jgi:RNA polymerase sigma factor (sigma-70 family)
MLAALRHRRTFPSTDWSLVRSIRRRVMPQPDAAVAELCTIYWYPVYAYLRRRGHRADEAEDLTQSFFAHVLSRDLLNRAQPERGRLRSYLLACLANFVANERERAVALKRGGPACPRLGAADAQYSAEPADHATPERLYERRWAMAVLERVLDDLRGNYVRAGKGDLFDALKDQLIGDTDDASYRRVAQTLGISEGALRVTAHRLRRRYRERLRDEIARTVTGPEEDVRDEMRYLFNATRG